MEEYSLPIAENRGKTFSSKDLDIEIQSPIRLGRKERDPQSLPAGIHIDADLGIAAAPNVQLTQLHAWPRPNGFVEPQRGVITPRGDFLIGAAVGAGHQFGTLEKKNSLVTYRSSDRGQTWSEPSEPWVVPYNQHAFNPFIPSGSNRIYVFGTDFHPDYTVLPHNGAVSLRYSDDDGHTWSEPKFIAPENRPDWRGVGHMQACETDSGAWLIGTYFIMSKPDHNRADRQYILRSEDKGETWTLLPHDKPEGWFLREYDRMLEGLPVNCGGGLLAFFIRTSEGHIWRSESRDDGLTWIDPEPTTLVHPDAPPMIFRTGRGDELVAFIHNCPPGGLRFADDTARWDRNEIWASCSRDGGLTWSEPRYLLSNAAMPSDFGGSGGVEVCYADLIVDGSRLHLIFDHRKRQVVIASFDVEELDRLPTASTLGAE